MKVRGVELELHPSPDYVSDVIRETGDFYEAAILDEIARRVTGGVLVDVGAMIGNHTAYLQAFVPNDGIIAFEPVWRNRDLLIRNTDKPPIKIYGMALSDFDGEAWMTVDPTNLGHSVMNPLYGVEQTRVRRLDSFDLQDVALLKIDVEGGEAAVLRGASETIARCRPLIVIEDWSGKGYDLPGYQLAAEWEQAHQTFMYEPID